MAPALPDPWRASMVIVAMGAAAGVFFGVLIASSGQLVEGIAAGLILGGFAVAAEMQAAVRLNRALARFAAEMPTTVPGEPYTTWASVQGIRWPGLGVEVSGRVASFGVRGLEVRIGAEAFVVPPRKAAEGAREVAARLRGVAPPAF